MNKKYPLLAICGSTRRSSSNLSLIRAIAELSSGIFDITIFTGLAALPHFNPDLDNEAAPAQVIDFRARLRETEGILICTPEYAMGVPGTLKNAIDWTVSSCEFSHKPAALITASSQGSKAHSSLLDTLRIIESDITDDTQLLISFVKTRVSPDNKITDPPTLEAVQKLIAAFAEKIRARRGEVGL